MPLPDVAAALGIPLGTAKSRLHRSLALMRAAIDADARDPGLAGRGRAVRMTAFDRIERRLPELIDELASAGRPRLLRRHAPADRAQLASGRPGAPSKGGFPWASSPDPLPIRPMPWRLIAIVALLGLLAVATLVYVGSRQRVAAAVRAGRATARSSSARPMATSSPSTRLPARRPRSSPGRPSTAGRSSRTTASGSCSIARIGGERLIAPCSSRTPMGRASGRRSRRSGYHLVRMVAH